MKAKNHSLRLIGLILGGLLFHSGTARAAEYLNDDFIIGTGDYSTSSNIAGQTSASSTGFVGAWGGNSTNYFKPSATNLTLTGYSSTGGSFGFMGFNGSLGSRSDNRSFTATSGASTLWFGSLLDTDSNTLSHGSAMMGFLSGGLTTTSGSDATSATWTSSNGGTLDGFAWGISNGGLAVAYQTGSGTVTTVDPTFSISAGTTYLLLAQLQLNTSSNDDTLNVWALTSVPTSQGSLGTPTFSVSSADILSASTDLNTLVAYASVSTTGTNAQDLTEFDAIRAGTSFSDVVAVPEPPTVVLAGLAVLFLVLVARTRRVSLGSF